MKSSSGAKVPISKPAHPSSTTSVAVTDPRKRRLLREPASSSPPPPPSKVTKTVPIAAEQSEVIERKAQVAKRTISTDSVGSILGDGGEKKGKLRTRVEQLTEALECVRKDNSKRALKLLRNYSKAQTPPPSNDVCFECWNLLISLLNSSAPSSLPPAAELKLRRVCVNLLSKQLGQAAPASVADAQKLWDHFCAGVKWRVSTAISTPNLILPLCHLAVVKLKLSVTHSNGAKELERLIDAALQSNRGGRGQVLAIALLVKLHHTSLHHLERRLIDLTSGPNPLVRGAAVKALSRIAETNEGISLQRYKEVAGLCTDRDCTVRLTALKMVVAMARQWGNQHVTLCRSIKSYKNHTLRLEDDAFGLVCQAVNDIELPVRVAATRLLGRFTSSVSEPFLLQTLDKKLIAQMRADQGGSRGRHQHYSSIWSTGRKMMGGDVEAERDDEVGQSLIPTSACGAFITALEDEFQEVRQAAVSSLSRLALNTPELARISINHLADMFNDEIGEVRLDAIKALGPLMVHGTLEEDHLNTILSMLDDATTENRMAIHGLISRSNLESADCIRRCCKSLLVSLKRFPHDRHSIYNSMASIGQRHAMFVHGLVDELLDMHPIFHTVEQHIDDEYYLGKLILLLNAASKQPVMCSLIPPYVKHHYRYLRCASPHLIPHISALDKAGVRAKAEMGAGELARTPSRRVESETLLAGIYERLTATAESAAGWTGARQRSELLDLVISDLNTLKGLEEELATPAGLLHRFCSIVKLHDSAITKCQQAAGQLLDEPGPVFSLIAECANKIDWVMNHYTSIPDEVLAFLEECSLRLKILIGAVKLEADPALYDDIFKAMSAEIPAARQALVMLKVPPSPPIVELIAWISVNVTAGRKEGRAELARGMMEILGKTLALGSIPKRFGNLGQISMKSVAIVDPTKETQLTQTHRFVAGMPHGVQLSCLLYGLTQRELGRVRIRVDYPDNATTFFRPPMKDFHALPRENLATKGSGTTTTTTTTTTPVRLSTTVIVTSMGWMEPLEVYLTCGLMAPAANRTTSSPILSVTSQEVAAIEEQRSMSKERRRAKAIEGRFCSLPDADAKHRINKAVVKIHPMGRA